MNQIDRDEIVTLTEKYGGQWGINHIRRLLHLIAIIGEGQEYDEDVVWVAAHLHDWGAYPHWQRAGVDHVVRSKEVSEAFLKEHNYPETFSARVLECIALHHDYAVSKSLEALLLSDADGLDFLGVVGVLRDISKNPRNLRQGYEISRQRRNSIPEQLVLERSQEIALIRSKQMDELYEHFAANTFEQF